MKYCSKERMFFPDAEIQPDAQTGLWMHTPVTPPGAPHRSDFQIPTGAKGLPPLADVMSPDAAIPDDALDIEDT